VNQKDNPARRKRSIHQERVWSTSHPHEVARYQETPDISLRLVEASKIDRHAHILDVGGGASTLVDSPREITTLVGADFQLSEIVHENHFAPGRPEQRFTYFRLQRQP